MPTTDEPGDGYWMISHTNLAAMLNRVKTGEDPAAVMAEEFANCDHELLRRLQPTIDPHEIVVLHSAGDLRGGSWTIRFQCSVASCLSGSVTAAPARSADQILNLIRAGHADTARTS